MRAQRRARGPRLTMATEKGQTFKTGDKVRGSSRESAYHRVENVPTGCAQAPRASHFRSSTCSVVFLQFSELLRVPCLNF